MFGNHGLCGLLEESAHEKSPKCLGGNLGDFGEFCKDLSRCVGNHGLFSLLKESAHEKSPKCLSGNLGDFGEFCKGLKQGEYH